MRTLDIKNGTAAQRMHNLVSFLMDINARIQTRLIGDSNESVLMTSSFYCEDTVTVITKDDVYVGAPGRQIDVSYLWTMTPGDAHNTAISEYEVDRLGWQTTRPLCVECLTCGCTCAVHTGTA